VTNPTPDITSAGRDLSETKGIQVVGMAPAWNMRRRPFSWASSVASPAASSSASKPGTLFGHHWAVYPPSTR